MSDSDISLVRARRSAIAKLRAELDAEDADLDITERTLERLAAGRVTRITKGELTVTLDPVAVRASGIRITAKGSGTVSPLSHKEMILGALDSAPEIWIKDATALQARIKEIHSVEIPKTSLYPYLSDFKAKGFIERGKNGEIASAARVARSRMAAE